MTFDQIKDRHLLKIGEEDGNSTESTAQIVDRIAEAYWRICKATGCTYKPPALASLSAVTATTNKHGLVSALSLSTEIFGVDKVFWDGEKLLAWNKDSIDHANLYWDTTSGDPLAYAYWEEIESNAKVSYIGFYPFVASANTTDCYISYFDRPTQPTTSTITTAYPQFPEEYHHLISELSALEFLRDMNRKEFTSARWRLCWDEINKMRDHWVMQINRGNRAYSQSERGYGHRYRFYGEG